MARVALVEDEALFRDLLRVSLAQHDGLQVVGVFADPDSALREIPTLHVDVAILDIDLASPMTGVELGVRLRRALPDLGIMLLSNHADPQLLSSLPSDVVAGYEVHASSVGGVDLFSTR